MAMKDALKALVFTVVALALVNPPVAKADSFTFSASNLSGASITANLTGTYLGGGKYLVTAVDGVITGMGSNFVEGSFSAIIPNTTSPITTFATPTNAFIADDVLAPLGGPGAIFDGWGLAFRIGAAEVDLWGNNDGTYSLFEWVNGGYVNGASNSPNNGQYLSTLLTSGRATPITPEPVTLVLFGSGLAGIGGLVRHRMIG
jgi:hypothetical protein